MVCRKSIESKPDKTWYCVSIIVMNENTNILRDRSAGAEVC